MENSCGSSVDRGTVNPSYHQLAIRLSIFLSVKISISKMLIRFHTLQNQDGEQGNQYFSMGWFLFFFFFFEQTTIYNVHVT